MRQTTEQNNHPEGSKTFAGGVIIAIILAIGLVGFDRGSLDYNLLVFFCTSGFIFLAYYGFVKENYIVLPIVWLLFSLGGGIILFAQLS